MIVYLGFLDVEIFSEVQLFIETMFETTQLSEFLLMPRLHIQV